MCKIVTRARFFPMVLAGLVIAGLVGCSTAPKTEAKRDKLMTDVESGMAEMKAADPGLDKLIKDAYGYAFFPTIGKGGVGVGGAYGRGLVYEQGNFIGYSDMKQATIGLQLGGQSFKELILFQDKAALDRFTSESFEFSANASAVAVTAGASAAAKYENGVAILTQPNGGLMFEASVGGQKFNYLPKEAKQ